MRRVKIIATVGPATAAPERLEALLHAGVDVVRLNFSHGTLTEHEKVMANVRSIAAKLERPVAVLQDLAGPKIRIGSLENGGPITLREGADLTITTKPVVGTERLLSTTYKRLPQDVRPGDPILLADGALSLLVRKVDEHAVHATVVHGGLLAEHQGINLPGVAISAPALTDKDRKDVAFGIGLGVDYVALSFVRNAAHVRSLKRLIALEGADTPVIAKLEKREAVDGLDDILGAADGVMVARGDLGVELPLEEVPGLQKRIIGRANERGLTVITATQMLQSMIHNPRPTRAEVSDVANAILDGTDAVMLSGETAIGEYPIEAVEMMERIARATVCGRGERRMIAGRATHAEAICRAAVGLGEDVQAEAMVVFTRSGFTASLISKERPAMPVFALTDREAIYRRLALYWGVTPLLTELREQTDAMLAHMEHLLISRGLLAAGSSVVVVGSTPQFATRTNFVKVQRLGE